MNDVLTGPSAQNHATAKAVKVKTANAIMNADLCIICPTPDGITYALFSGVQGLSRQPSGPGHLIAGPASRRVAVH